MRIVIVDDNEIARLTICKLVEHTSECTVVGQFDDGFKALDFLRMGGVDLIFLDIEMEQMSGIELLRSLPQPRPLTIFMTAKNDYAIEAFDLNVIDYLIKPVLPARYFQAIEKALELFQRAQDTIKQDKDDFLFIRDSGIVRRISLDDILYFEAMGDYVKVFTKQKMYAIHKSMKAIEERLPPIEFIRIHRSYIVAVRKIDSLEQGALAVGGKVIPVADAYRGAVVKRLNIL
ncbi:MAG: response regulator transcription factor [Saprospiraceae bacterium]|nr:response regulator transcription factor [Saprospiraceae bacterium]